MKNLLWTNKNTIASVIEQRLKLQSTQKALEEFDVYLPDAHSIKLVLKEFRQWDEKKQNKFIKIIGGAAHFNKTKEFISEL